MTGQNVIDRAHGMVGDVGITKRNAVSDMVTFLNDGVRDLLARRPYLRLNADGTQDAAFTEVTASTLSNALPLDDENLREPLAHYIAYRIFEIDAEDEFNLKQSQTHYAHYIRTT
jgi:hypothetical protein